MRLTSFSPLAPRRRWITPHEDVLFNELYYFQELKDLTKVRRLLLARDCSPADC